MDFAKVSSLITAEMAGLKLILSLLSTYLISLFYQIFLIKLSVRKKCIFFIFTGLLLAYFNYGFNTIHLLLTIWIVFCTLHLFPGSVFWHGFIMVFTMSYLLAGYFATQTARYGFHWTIPHCVLTLRLIAISFNLLDGHRCRARDGKACEHEDHLDQIPGLLEFTAHCLFPCSFLVGPQFEFHIFHKFIRRTEQTYQIVWKQALAKLFCGFVYFAIFMIGTQKIQLNYMVTRQFLNSSFFYKMTVLAIISKIHLMKYIFVWLFTEGGLILSGLTYDKKQNISYDVFNVDILRYETTSQFDGIIKSFNIQTNTWTAKYIYKRLKFLKSKVLSHLCSLLFLAIWHGHKSGYYATFFMEFVTVVNEKETSSVFHKLQAKYPLFKRFVNNVIVDNLIYTLLKVNIFYSLAYAFTPFLLLTHTRYWLVIKSTYYFFFIQAPAIFIANKLIRLAFLSSPPASKKVD